jgi:hypothetical protein
VWRPAGLRRSFSLVSSDRGVDDCLPPCSAENRGTLLVAQLVEALCYNREGRGFDSRWCNWNFSLTTYRPHYGPGVDSASNRNEYQE